MFDARFKSKLFVSGSLSALIDVDFLFLECNNQELKSRPARLSK